MYIPDTHQDFPLCFAYGFSMNFFKYKWLFSSLLSLREGGTLRKPTPFGRVLTKSSLNKS